jgi:hypothetical protein
MGSPRKGLSTEHTSSIVPVNTCTRLICKSFCRRTVQMNLAKDVSRSSRRPVQAVCAITLLCSHCWRSSLCWVLFVGPVYFLFVVNKLDSGSSQGQCVQSRLIPRNANRAVVGLSDKLRFCLKSQKHHMAWMSMYYRELKSASRFSIFLQVDSIWDNKGQCVG